MKRRIRRLVPSKPRVVQRPVHTLLDKLPNKAAITKKFVHFLRELSHSDTYVTEESTVPLSPREDLLLRLPRLPRLKVRGSFQIGVQEVPERDVLAIPDLRLEVRRHSRS